MNVLENLQKAIMQYFYCIFLVTGVSQTNGCHRPVELFIQAFLGLAVVIYTTGYEFYISSIGGQSSLLFGCSLPVLYPVIAQESSPLTHAVDEQVHNALTFL